MERRKYVIGVVASLCDDRVVAEAIVDRLQEEGLLQLGYGNSDVDRIVETFSRVFGTTKTSQRDRWAARRLADVHTAQAVCGIIQLLGSTEDSQYKPVVGSVAELEEKFVKVMNYLRKQSDNAPIEVG